jgi:hypothetical protein
MSAFLHEEHKGLLVGYIHGARYERTDKSEADVEIPPAFIITDSDGAAWTLGTQYAVHNGEFEFNVLRNDVDTDEIAKRIVYRRRRVWIFGHYGWKHFSHSHRCFI